MGNRLKKLFSVRKHRLLAAIVPSIVILDQITKAIVVKKFYLGESLIVLRDYFSLTYIRNKGAAFGLMAGADSSFRVPFFLIVPLVALGIIVSIFRKLPPKDVRLATALSLVMGGAVGNLIDRVRYGYVVDFLDFHWHYKYHFPAFNVADSAITIGVGILMLDLLQGSPQLGAGPRKKKK